MLRENPLRRGNGALTPCVHLAGLPQRTSERLEGGLHNVVTVGAAQLPNVQRHTGRVCQGLEEMLHQLGLVFTDALCWEI